MGAEAGPESKSTCCGLLSVTSWSKPGVSFRAEWNMRWIGIWVWILQCRPLDNWQWQNPLAKEEIMWVKHIANEKPTQSCRRKIQFQPNCQGWSGVVELAGVIWLKCLRYFKHPGPYCPLAVFMSLWLPISVTISNLLNFKWWEDRSSDMTSIWSIPNKTFTKKKK